MRRTKRLTIFVFAGLLASEIGFADELYVLRFLPTGGKSSGCRQAIWSSDVLFYNQNVSPATVRLLDISNGELAPGTLTSMALAPRQATAVSYSRIAADWGPTDLHERMWIMHLDVPAGVIVESRDEVHDQLTCIVDPLPNAPIKTPMPVFRSLVPPGTEQVKLGTDLGSTPARQNVTIYNAGEQMASATIEVKRACDDQIVDSRIVTIPGRTIMQFGGLTTGSNQCTGTEVRTNGYARYTVITVDQPSLSLVSTLTEEQPLSLGNIVPFIEFSVK
jgi:hypothetical protein